MISNFLQGKKVLAMGLGLVGGGVDAVKWLAAQGAKITVTDLRNKKELKPSLEKLKNYKIKYVLGKHRIKDFINTDLIIKNPAVPSSSPYLKAARKAKINIETDLSLFFKFYPGQIIGITGTKGKSTTASLIYEILKKANQSVFLAGNIGQSPLKYLNVKMLKCYNVKMILELSSFQLEDLKVSPQIAVITNLFPDHLNRYKNFREYVKTKEIIFKYQKPNDFLVLNYDNITVRESAKKARAKKYWYSCHKLPAAKQGVFIDNGKICWLANHKPTRIAEIKDIKLLGEHNLSNVLAAVTAACLVGVDPKIIKKVLKHFAGIPNRLELVAAISGVKYINDTTATNPDAAIAGIKAVGSKRRIILISGGADKNLKFENFAEIIKKYCQAVILLPGTATSKLKCKMQNVKFKMPIVEASNMKEAVKQAKKIARKGDIVLLSPGCASFGLLAPSEIRKKHFFIKDKCLTTYILECKKKWGIKSLAGFKNEFDRGQQFKRAVADFV